MVVDRPLKKSGAPPAVNPDAIFSLLLLLLSLSLSLS
jgi:hypothetical protein